VGRSGFSTIMKAAPTLLLHSHFLSFRTFTVGQYLSYPLLYNSTRENKSITETTASKINEMKTVPKTARKVPAHDLPRLASSRPTISELVLLESKIEIQNSKIPKTPFSKQFKPFQGKKL
jgi:hypothetical protein